MQKESAYNPHDVSYADAIGLLQMIPPTSRRVGEKIDYPYTDDILYDPEGNIRFGACESPETFMYEQRSHSYCVQVSFSIRELRGIFGSGYPLNPAFVLALDASSRESVR